MLKLIFRTAAAPLHDNVVDESCVYLSDRFVSCTLLLCITFFFTRRRLPRRRLLRQRHRRHQDRKPTISFFHLLRDI